MRYDAVILGAGPAGATAALRLARAGLRVAVVEKASFPRRKVCGEFVSAPSWALLRRLGVAPTLLAIAGPAVRRVGLFAGEAAAAAPMPVADPSQAWGHAVGREHLDPALLDAAVGAGASAWQPWSARELRDEGGAWRVEIADRHGATRALHARIVVAAHGSWEPGNLATQLPRAPRRASDLLGFKARFDGAALDADLMPLVLFPGGYGGLVRSDAGAVSFSCCIRRDALARCRAQRPGLAAGDAVLAHARASCRALREALGAARAVAPWLSAGPIRPGIRPRVRGRLFAAGNAAGEAHPLVAEGISMAIQASWLLADALAAEGSLGDAAVQAAGRRYEGEWQRHFAPRIRASRVFAALTTAPATSAASIAALAAMPRILTLGAAWSGKARAVRAAEASP